MQGVCDQLDSLTGSLSDTLADLLQLGASVNFSASLGPWPEKQTTEHAHEFANI